MGNGSSAFRMAFFTGFARFFCAEHEQGVYRYALISGHGRNPMLRVRCYFFATRLLLSIYSRLGFSTGVIKRDYTPSIQTLSSF